jgi:arylsulfatase A
MRYRIFTSVLIFATSIKQSNLNHAELNNTSSSINTKFAGLREMSKLSLRVLSRLVVIPILIFSQVILCHTSRRIHADKTETRTKEKQPPNIVILFADNFGWNDVSSYSHVTPPTTPNIDRLAETGMKFYHWNSATALCSPSRAALLTGKYPIRTGVYPRVFHPDSVYGLPPEEMTLAEYLKELGYQTSILGKWHLGHREQYLPTNQGFDEYLGVPFHMSGGSIDPRICAFDSTRTMWLPLYNGTDILQQPVQVEKLAPTYTDAATSFIRRSAEAQRPFFLYMAFNHVHQLCAPLYGDEANSCQWASSKFSNNSPSATFLEAVSEMDWIAGEILNELQNSGVSDNTLVIFTSDNGPWVAEKSCSGSKGPFLGQWLQDHVDRSCTACPNSYIASPTAARPRRCTLPSSSTTPDVDGIHCGEDTGLGSVWEANLRMPAFVSWPQRIPGGTESWASVSTLDVLPTVLSIVAGEIPEGLDGMDISPVLFNYEQGQNDLDERVLFFWRDGFSYGPFPPPIGRMDVAAAKLGRYKGWFYTKSAHNNPDVEVYHDPILLFDIIDDPAESHPLDVKEYSDVVDTIVKAVAHHKETVYRHEPLGMATDPKYRPCADRNNHCRTGVMPSESLDFQL